MSTMNFKVVYGYQDAGRHSKFPHSWYIKVRWWWSPPHTSHGSCSKVPNIFRWSWQEWCGPCA